MPANENQIEQLLSREAIRDLPKLYCHFVWRNDVEGLVGLFARDGVFDEPNIGRIVGHDRLREVYRRALGGLSPKPFIHNHVVTLEGSNSASGACYLDLRVPERDGAASILGYYDDRYIREDGVWRFAERKVTLLGSLSPPLSQGLANAGTR